jgi:N-acetylneuraminate lyase
MQKFSGVIPAVVTPFDSTGGFSPAAFERLLDRLYKAGVHGVYVCGQTGEGLLQSVAQREEVAAAAVRCSPSGKTVIIHVGASCVADAIRLAKHAARTGAHAISSLPPLGNYSFAEIKAYYQILAAASELPLLIYYFPALSPAITHVQQIIELCEIPNVVGLKFTDFDLFKMSIVKESGATVFSGYDEVLVAGLLMGADGGIGTFYNLVPELFVQIYELSVAQKWQEARAVQKTINDLIRAFGQLPFFPAVKRMLAWSGIDCGECLPPRRSLSETEESQLRAKLAALGLRGLFY